jgi:ribosome-binding protein aMBF1 (putative translation factor)
MDVSNLHYTAQTAESGDRSEARSATAAANASDVGLPESQALTDKLVTAIRDAHEQRGIGYRTLARMFQVKRSTVQKYCRYQRRATAHYGGIGIAVGS